MAEDKDPIQEIPGELNDFYSDDDIFSISSWGADLSFRELSQRFDDDELVKPELQRKYVWDKSEASRFIDSILLGLPVPSIFLAKTSDEKMLIVDGYQRIMTVHDFVKGVFSTDGKVFKLTNSEKINRRWRGKAFAELQDTEQRKIRNTTIHAIVFVQKHPTEGDTSLYQVFERINTSGRSLMPQEIRNCVYQGGFNSLLFELNKYENWRKQFGSETEDSRMRDLEFILRFFALSSDLFRSEPTERISLKKFLNRYMGVKRNPPVPEIESMRERFRRSIDFTMQAFGAAAFQNISPTQPDKLVNKFSPTIFDSILIATDYALKKGAGTATLPTNAEAARRALLGNETYRHVISQETMRTESINTRINCVCESLYGLEYE
jgi:hypothetical protein